MYEKSVSDPGAFWTDIASDFEWKGAALDPAKALEYNFDRDAGDIFVKWFAGSETNLAYNCLDRQVTPCFPLTPFLPSSFFFLFPPASCVLRHSSSFILCSFFLHPC